MKSFQTKVFFVFLATAFALSACGGSGGTNQNANSANQSSNVNTNSNLTKDDAEEFAKSVNLPFVPEEVVWRETDAASGKKMIAVLRFSAAAAQTIAAQAEKYKPSARDAIDAEDWFPPELVAQSQQSGDEVLKGTSYAANDFYSEIYKNGKLTRVNDTNYFVLELTN
ncbi:MAG TPA: hypothetical protein VGC76_15885 [Pyrinomonadaceae bacterium]|jgi:hypothetical protein